MLEIDITDFFNLEDPFQFAASRAELGDRAAEITWDAAMAYAMGCGWLTDEDDRQTFRDYLGGFGAWDDEQRAAWTPQHCTALLVQLIAGDMREGHIGDNGADTAAEEWAAYEARAEAGQCSGRISRGNDAHAGRVFYFIGD